MKIIGQNTSRETATGAMGKPNLIPKRLLRWLVEKVLTRKTAVGAVRKVVPAIVILAFNPYHLLDRQAEISNNIVMAATAPFYPFPQKLEDKGQGRITTVLFRQSDLDGEVLKGLKSWPPTLDQYAVFLRKIAKYDPSAIFIDLNIGPHPGEGRGQFSNSLQALKARGIPVFLAQLQHEDVGSAAEQHPVDVSADPAFDNLIAGRILAEWRGYHENYPLRVVGRDGLWHMSPSARLWLADLERRFPNIKQDANKSTLSEDERSLLKMQMLKDDDAINDDVVEEEPEPMVVRWASSLPPDMEDYGLRNAHCLKRAEGARWPTLKSSLSVLAQGLSPSLSNTPTWNVVTRCPHYVTLNLKEVLSLTDTSLQDEDLARARKAFEGRIILIGADVVGLNDYRPSPVHGQVQGVLLHAMALDNLLNFGMGYLTDVPHHWSHVLEFLFDIIAMLVASFAVSRPAKMLLKKPGEVGSKGDWRVLCLLMCFALSGIAGGWYGGLPQIVLAVPIGLWIVTIALALWGKALVRWLHSGPDQSCARAFTHNCLYLGITAISSIGAFTIFVALSFVVVGLLFLGGIAPVPWLFIVTVSLYATIGEPMIEAFEHLIGKHEEPKKPEVPHSHNSA